MSAPAIVDPSRVVDRSLITLPADLPQLNAYIFRRAQRDIPLLEDPLYSNRAPWLDALCRKWGVPLASYWCALWTAEVWQDAGADVPPIDVMKKWHPAIVQTWYEWALETGRFSHVPAIGCAVLYGTHGHAPCHHIAAAVASVTPMLTDFEGNASATPGDRNGELTTCKPVDVDLLVGYIHPLPVRV